MGIATAQARPYYMFTGWLRGMCAGFDVLEPAQMSRYDGHIILTTRDEAAVDRPSGCALLFPDELERGSATALCLLLRRLGIPGDDLVVGIDTGKLLGLAISYAGREVEMSLFTRVRDLVLHVSSMVQSIRPSRCIIRIGDGDMESAFRILRGLGSAYIPPHHIQLVDESGTSPRGRNCNRRGRRDMLAARSISKGFGHNLPGVIMS